MPENPNDFNTPDLMALRARLAGIDYAKVPGLFSALPGKLVVRGSRPYAAAAPAAPEIPRTPAVIVEDLQQRVKAVFLENKASDAIVVLDTCYGLLRLSLNRPEDIALGQSRVGHAELLEPVVLCLVRAFEENPLAQSLLADSTPAILQVLAARQFHGELYERTAAFLDWLGRILIDEDQQLKAFVDDAMDRLAPVCARSPELKRLLGPALHFQTLDTEAAKKTRRNRDEARAEGYEAGVKEAAARQATARPPSQSATTIQVTPAAPPDALPPAPATRARSR